MVTNLFVTNLLPVAQFYFRFLNLFQITNLNKPFKNRIYIIIPLPQYEV